MKPEIEEDRTKEVRQEFVAIEVDSPVCTPVSTESTGGTKNTVGSTECTKVCRVCHLPLEADGIELGCLCKNDLSVAHRKCAYTWFKIKGSKTCEICGQPVKNVVMDRTCEGRPRQVLVNVEISSTVEESRPACKQFIWNIVLALCVTLPFLPWLFRVHLLKL